MDEQKRWREYDIVMSKHSEQDVNNLVTTLQHYLTQNKTQGAPLIITKDALLERSKELVIQYNLAMCHKGFALKRGQLRKKDLIDMRNLLHASDTTSKHSIPNITMFENESDFIDANEWYAFVPCFTEGVLQINAGRYIYWNIIEVTYNKTMKLFIKDYTAIEQGWEGGVEGTIDCSFDADGQKFVSTSADYKLCTHHYTVLDLESLGWTPYDIAIWTGLILAGTKKMDEKMRDTHGTNAFSELIRLFTNLIVKVNYQLYIHKTSKTIYTKKDKSKKGETSVEIIDTDAPKKLVRIIGDMSVNSVQKPRLPTEKTVMRYSIASWKCRGGLRHMKDGRIIPFKESIHHRQCMKKTADIPQSIITFKKEKTSNDHTDSHDITT